MFVRGVFSGVIVNYRYIMFDDVEFKSICEKVFMGNINVFED